MFRGAAAFDLARCEPGAPGAPELVLVSWGFSLQGPGYPGRRDSQVSFSPPGGLWMFVPALALLWDRTCPSVLLGLWDSCSHRGTLLGQEQL